MPTSERAATRRSFTAAGPAAPRPPQPTLVLPQPPHRPRQALSWWVLYAVAFAARPLGAVLFGGIADAWGRRVSLLLTITTMGAATGLVGCLPTYHQAGAAAPAALSALRILTGLAVGGEFTAAVRRGCVGVRGRGQGRAGARQAWLGHTGPPALLVVGWDRVALLVCARLVTDRGRSRRRV